MRRIENDVEEIGRKSQHHLDPKVYKSVPGKETRDPDLRVFELHFDARSNSPAKVCADQGSSSARWVRKSTLSSFVVGEIWMSMVSGSKGSTTACPEANWKTNKPPGNTRVGVSSHQRGRQSWLKDRRSKGSREEGGFS